MGNLRTKEMLKKYTKFRADGFLDEGCNLCKESSIKDFNYWRILDNRFPWDTISKTHHMIVPKRHILYEELNDEEKKEYDFIKSTYMEEYDMIAEATNKNKSIPQHFHLHLIVTKDLK